MDEVRINPIGVVKSTVDNIYAMPMGGQKAIVEVKKAYAPALHRIGENSHIWIICWFDRADRGILRVKPRIMGADAPEFGVFAIRAFSRPNPIAITPVCLEKVEGNLLHVTGLDAVEGTPVLDIKPYYEQDSIFSPCTSYVKPEKDRVRYMLMSKLAHRHHGKISPALEIGVRICMVAENRFGNLQAPGVCVTVNGSRELADVVQGITRARLANPPRFTFHETADKEEAIFTKNHVSLQFIVKGSFSLKELSSLDNENIFTVIVN